MSLINTSDFNTVCSEFPGLTDCCEVDSVKVLGSKVFLFFHFSDKHGHRVPPQSDGDGHLSKLVYKQKMADIALNSQSLLKYLLDSMDIFHFFYFSLQKKFLLTPDLNNSSKLVAMQIPERKDEANSIVKNICGTSFHYVMDGCFPQAIYRGNEEVGRVRLMKWKSTDAKVLSNMFLIEET